MESSIVVKNWVCFIIMVSSDAVSVSEMTSTLYLVMASGLSGFAGDDVGVVVVATGVVASGLDIGSRLNFLR